MTDLDVLICKFSKAVDALSSLPDEKPVISFKPTPQIHKLTIEEQS